MQRNIKKAEQVRDSIFRKEVILKVQPYIWVTARCGTHMAQESPSAISLSNEYTITNMEIGGR